MQRKRRQPDLDCANADTHERDWPEQHPQPRRCQHRTSGATRPTSRMITCQRRAREQAGPRDAHDPEQQHRRLRRCCRDHQRDKQWAGDPDQFLGNRLQGVRRLTHLRICDHLTQQRPHRRGDRRNERAGETGEQHQWDVSRTTVRREHQRNQHDPLRDCGRWQYAQPTEPIDEPALHRRCGRAGQRVGANGRAGRGIGAGGAAHQQQDRQRRHSLRQATDQCGTQEPTQAGQRQHRDIGTKHPTEPTSTRLN